MKSGEEAVKAAVIGIPDPRWGERPLALVVLKEDAIGQVTPQQVSDHVAR